MDNAEFMATAQNAANQLLMWVGFGTLVGLLAKAIMPGKDPGGAVATLAMGIAGTFIGCGVVSYFWQGQIITPISPVGFCVATGGAFILLFFYKLLGGYYFDEGYLPLRRARRTTLRKAARRQPVTVVYDEE